MHGIDDPWEPVVEAWLRSDEAALHRSLDPWRHRSAPAVARTVLERCLAAPPEQRPPYEAIAHALLSHLPARKLPAVDGMMRAWSASRGLELDGLGVGGLGLLSMQRNGFTREDATAALVQHTGALALRLLLVRCNDVVAPIATRARDAVEDGLDKLDDLTSALPLLDVMRTMVRAASTGLPDRVDARFVAEPRGHAALRRALSAASDPDVRRHAVRLLLRVPDEALAAMRLGLDDPDPAVRLHTARSISGKGTEQDLQQDALPRLLANPSPSVRLIGLQIARRFGAEREIREAVFDRAAPVRHRARRYVAKLGINLDIRGEALARLTNEAVLLSALATLSDVGRSEDRIVVEPFTRHPRRRVAREARRTLSLLGG